MNRNVIGLSATTLLAMCAQNVHGYDPCGGCSIPSEPEEECHIIAPDAIGGHIMLLTGDKEIDCDGSGGTGGVVVTGHAYAGVVDIWTCEGCFTGYPIYCDDGLCDDLVDCTVASSMCVNSSPISAFGCGSYSIGISAQSRISGVDSCASASATLDIDPTTMIYESVSSKLIDNCHECIMSLPYASANLHAFYGLTGTTGDATITFWLECQSGIADATGSPYFQYMDTPCGCAWVLCMENGATIGSPNLTIGTGGRYELTCNMGAGPVEYDYRSVQGSLVIFDVNKDGRFNSDDVDELYQISLNYGSQSTTDPSILDFSGYVGMHFDINTDGSVDTLDIELIEDMVACGLHTGIFGDANGDGTIKCTDETAQSAFPLTPSIFGSAPYIPVYAGDPDYMIELDVNLDGVLNQIDQDAFNLLFTGCP